MILNTVILLGGIGLVFGFILAVAAKKFAVPVDPRQEHLLRILPGANCGACGFPGCSGYAEAMIKEGADPGLCTAGGTETVEKIGEILGREASLRERRVARVLCGGRDCEQKFNYVGINECYAASSVAGGFKSCRYACLGLGDCVKACNFDAIRWEPGKIPEIIPQKCTACGKCIEACPVNVIKLIPEKAEVYVKCGSHDKGPSVKKICKAGCFACRICVKFCPEKAITIEENLAVIDYSRCNGCGICVKKCPSKTIIYTEKHSSKEPEERSKKKKNAESQATNHS